MSNHKTVKAILTKKFDISLIQDEDGRYCIEYKTYAGTEYSEWLTDYSNASYLFDLKLQELEGN